LYWLARGRLLCRRGFRELPILTSSSRGGQRDGHGQATPWSLLWAQGPGHGFDEPSGQRQTKADAAGVAPIPELGAAEADEPAENADTGPGTAGGGGEYCR
jgi:hypothetical protein